MAGEATERDGATPADLAEVVARLYGMPPDEFTAARNAEVKQAKAAGDKELAQAIGALRKPSSAAWLINQLVRHQAAEIDQLLAVGAALREAQAVLDPGQLKELGRQRHQVVAAVSRQARALGRQLGNPVSNAVEAEVEQTLRAALADPAAGEALASGQLTKALDYAGLGQEQVDLTGAVAVSGVHRRPPAPARTTDVARDDTAATDAAAQRRRAELAQAEKDAEEAERDAAAAEAALTGADQHVAEVADRRRALEERVGELEAMLDDARDALSATGRETRGAGQDRERAAERAETARRAADRARARVTRLRAAAS